MTSNTDDALIYLEWHNLVAEGTPYSETSGLFHIFGRPGRWAS